MFEHTVSVLGWLALASLFGGMVFFPSVVAPRVFRVLQPDDAGRFLRALFPAYYVFMIVTSSLAALCFYRAPLICAGLAMVALSTLAVRQLLVPRINAWRDAQLAGDSHAGERFERGHRISVVINVAQLLFVAVAIGVLALR